MTEEASAFWVGFTLGALIFGIGVYLFTYDNIMNDAYGKGKAIQCMGKSGYHFTCEEKK